MTEFLIKHNPIAAIGHVLMLFLAAIGRVSIFTYSILSEGFRPPYYPRQIGRMII
jgi:hypothetical protein